MLSKIKYYIFKSYHRPSAKILHIFVFIKSLFFNKKTKIFSEKMFLLKNPPDSIIYLNSIGRIFIIILNFFTIILFNRFYSKNIFIDNGEKQDDKNKDLNFGDSKHVWPKQSLKYFLKKCFY